ncbi:MAG: hypothetical protein AAGA77_01050 [Bacteroidota bacterium]
MSSYKEYDHFEDLFYSYFPEQLRNYHLYWGSKPNKSLLLLMFLNKFCLGHFDLAEGEPLFSPHLRLHDHRIPNSRKEILLSDFPEYETMELVSPYIMAGSDGCGGTFYLNPLGSEGKLFHGHEEFEAISELSFNLIEVSKIYLPSQFLELFEVYKNSEPVRDLFLLETNLDDMPNLSEMKNELFLSLSISGYSNINDKLDYEYIYSDFVEYFSSQSPYWNNHISRANINSKFRFALLYLSFYKKNADLKNLIHLSHNLIGEVNKNLREFILFKLNGQLE